MNSKSTRYNVAMAILLCGVLTTHAQVLKLSDAYEMALKNEPKLRANAYRTAAVQEGVEQSKARLYPQIQGSVSYGQYEYNGPTLRAPIQENYKSYTVSANQGLYHPEVWRAVDQAKARSKGAHYEFQAQSQKLGLDLTKAYFNYVRTKRNVELLASEREYYETKYRQLEGMLTFGLTNRIDLLEAKIRRDKAVAEWLSEQKRSQVARVRLEYFIGGKVDEVPTYNFEAIDLKNVSMERAEWENKLTNNPSLRASITLKEIAVHEVAVREYGHYPTVDLSVSRKETDTQDPFSQRYNNQAVVQVTIPFYQGGYTQSRVRESKLQLDAAAQELKSTQQETLLKFDELWAERQFNVESLITLKESEKSAELYIQSVEKGHSAGLKSLVDLLEARAKFYAVKRDVIDAGYQLINNELALLDVVGELNVDKIASYETMFLEK